MSKHPEMFSISGGRGGYIFLQKENSTFNSPEVHDRNKPKNVQNRGKFLLKSGQLFVKSEKSD